MVQICPLMGDHTQLVTCNPKCALYIKEKEHAWCAITKNAIATSELAEELHWLNRFMREDS